MNPNEDSSSSAPADGDETSEPGLLDQTIELAKILKEMSDQDPIGHPSDMAVAVFRSWITVARERTDEPQYFDDVLQNYDAKGRSNKDLFDLFELLHPYVEIPLPPEPDDYIEPAPRRTFINLPTA